MNELAFPLLGALVVFLLAVPAATVIARAVLVLRRRSTDHLPGFGSTTTWLLIIAPVIAPVSWFVSAALHQSEPGGAIAACLYDHLGSEACHDALAFALCVSLLLLYAFARRARHELTRAPRAARSLPRSSRRARRLAGLCTAHPRLRDLRAVAVTGAVESICTRGLLRPRVEVSTDLIEALDDEALTAALLHEAEHAHALDPLRYFIASVCLSLNPLAAILRTDLRRWRLAREAACDEEAVRAGGEPLSLAQAIVTAAGAGARPTPVWAASLGEGGADGVRIRVGLLLGYAEGRKAWKRREAPFMTLTGVLTLVATLPHTVGSGPLDTIHRGIEQALVFLGLH